MNKSEQNKALILGTLAFMVSFTIWGLMAGLMPILKKDLGLTAQQASLLLALPVLLGSLGRIPVGILADRFGGRTTFSALLFFIVLPAVALGVVHTYNEYLLVALFLGLAGVSFSIGVSYVSRWFPPEKQGTALGIYGAGNVGQSIAVFGVPALVGLIGITWTAWTFAALTSIFALYFWLQAKDAEWHLPPKSFGQSMKLFFTEPMCWVLGLLYFQTFGGFVALSIYMPLFLKDLFALPAADAGLRTAVFVIVATVARPLGGWLSDQFGGGKVVGVSLVGLIPCAWLLSSLDLGYFTVGALAAAFLVGLGNGGVFKLVPQYFPQDAGTATGLVGAAGGMGGFFPPLVLGYCKDHFASYNVGFWMLAGFATLCLFVLYLFILKTSTDKTMPGVNKVAQSL